MTLREVTIRGQIRWRLSYCEADGQQRRLFFRDPETAIKQQEQLEEERKRLGNELGTIPFHERLEIALARQKVKAAGLSLLQAVEIALKKETLPEMNLQKAVEECLAAKAKKGLKDRSQSGLRNNLNLFIKGREKLSLAEITHKDCHDWVHEDGYAKATQQGRRTDLRNFLNWCVKRGYLHKSPAESLDPIIMDEKAPGILTVEQARRYMKAAVQVPGYLPYATIGLFCGVRPDEMRDLTWDDVDLDRARIFIRAEVSKTRDRRITPIQPNAVAFLRLAKKSGGDLPPTNWQSRMLQAREIAKIPWSHDCMRHSFASYRLANCQDASKVAFELGHTNPNTLYRHYREVVTPEEAAKFWAITPDSLKMA